MSLTLNSFKTKAYFVGALIISIAVGFFIWSKVLAISTIRTEIARLTHENTASKTQLTEARQIYRELMKNYANEVAKERAKLIQVLPSSEESTTIVRQIEKLANSFAKQDPTFDLQTIKFSQVKKQNDKDYLTLPFKISLTARAVSAFDFLRQIERTGQTNLSSERLLNVKNFDWQIQHDKPEFVNLNLALEAYFFGLEQEEAR